MPGPEVAAPEAGALLLWVAALAALIGYLVARGLLAGWSQTFGRMLEWLADELKFKVLGRGIDLGGPFRTVNRAVVRWLGAWAKTMDAWAGRAFHAGARVQEWLGHELWALSGNVLRLGNWLVWRHIPHVLKSILKWTLPGYAIYRLVRRILHAELPKALRAVKSVTITVERKLIRTIALPHEAEWDWLHHHWKALRRIVLGAAVAGGAAVLPWVHVFPRIRVLERFRVHTRKRLHRLERIFAAAGMAALMANALGLPNWRCITRGNLGRTARRICGMNPAFLEDVLGLLADFFILENICQVIPWLDAAAEDVGVPLAEFLTKVGAGLCEGSIGKSPTLNVPALSLPSSPGVTLYLP